MNARPIALFGIVWFAGLLVSPAARGSYEASWRVRPVRVENPGDDRGRPRVRIEGYFAHTGGPSNEMRAAPACGVMDFFCREPGPSTTHCRGTLAECDERCRREWADIAAAATKGACVAFSSKHWRGAHEVVRPPGSPFTGDPYDAVLGVATVPCKPEMPDAQRPDLTASCLASPPDAGPPATDAKPAGSQPEAAPAPPEPDAAPAPAPPEPDAAPAPAPPVQPAPPGPVPATTDAASRADAPQSTGAPTPPLAPSPTPSDPASSPGIACDVARGRSSGGGSAFVFAIAIAFATVRRAARHRNRQ